MLKAAKRIAGVLVGACTAITLVAQPAFAGEAFLSTDTTVPNTPYSGTYQTLTRTIFLAADTYDWDTYANRDYDGVNMSGGDRTITLAAGTYTWTCSMVGNGNLYVNSSLALSGHPTAYLNDPVGFSWSGGNQLTVSWGSELAGH